MLDAITIKGYKSIQSLEDFKIKNLNILIGANGAGKSNFISAIKLLNILLNKQLQAHTQDKGPDNFLHFGRKKTQEILLHFKLDRNAYEIKLIPTQENRLIIADETISFDGDFKEVSSSLGGNKPESDLENAEKKSDSKMVGQYTLQKIKTIKVYHFHDTSDTAKMKGVCSANDNLILKEDAQNIAPYLKMLSEEYPKHYEQIIDIIQDVAPFFGGFIFRNSENIQLEWFDKSDPDTPFKAHILSDGTLRFICLATLLLQPSELMPAVIIIDEPELGLHPYAIWKLSAMLQRVAQIQDQDHKKKQIIISTQSGELLNHFEAEDIIVVEKDNNQSTFKRLDSKELSIWLDEYSLSEIWSSNIIGGGPK